MKKNNNIELWRFIFTIGVALLHFGYINGFYIAVDFFFILSGFLICKSVFNGQQEEAGFYIKSRITRLYPHYLFSFIVMLIWNINSRLASEGVIAKTFFVDSLLEANFLQILYPFSSAVNGITWYISALIICIPIIIYCLIHYKNFYVHVIAPYSALFIYAYFLSNWAHIDFGLVWIGNCNGGLIRGFAGLNLGIVAYTLYKQLSVFNFTKLFHNILSVIELILFALVLVYACLFRQTKFDFAAIIILFVVTIIAFLEKGFLYKITNNKLVAYLGKLSYPMYLNQLFIGVMVASHWQSGNNIYRSVFFVLALIIYSMFTLKIVDLLTQITNKIFFTFRKKIISTDNIS